VPGRVSVPAILVLVLAIDCACDTTSVALHVASLTSTESASRCVLNMGGGQGTLKISNFLPLASVVDSRISTLRDEHSYCMVERNGRQGTAQ